MPAPSEPGAAVLRVATFNIRHGRPEGGRWLVDHRALVRACVALDVDLLGLQEVDTWSPRSWFARQGERIAAAGPQGDAAYVGARRPLLVGIEGNALVSWTRGTSPAAIAEVERHRLVRVGRTERRAVLIARAFGLTVAVSHLSKYGEEAARQLDHVLDLLAARPGPRLLLADANCNRTTFAAACGPRGYTVADGPPTFPASAPRLHIDHIAVDGGLLITHEEAPAAEVSDHRPLVATISRPASA